jgi:hypothetical protein
VHDQVGAERDRLAVDRGRAGRVERTPCASSAIAAMSVTSQSGLLGVSSQTTRVDGRSARRTAARSVVSTASCATPQRSQNVASQARNV